MVDDVLHLAGTDLDMTIQVRLEVGGDEDGVAVLPAKLTSDIVRALEPGAVVVEVTDGEARITSGRSQFVVRTLPVEEFLRLNEPPEDAVQLVASDFASALHQVVPAASHDDSRPILTGVLMTAEEGGLRLVATDSYRLALRDLKGSSVLREGEKVLVPSRALGELARVLAGANQVSLRLALDQACFEVGWTRVTTRLIEGEFPNYRQIIPPSYPNCLTVGKEPLLDAVRRVKLLAREGTPVRLALRAEGVELSAVTHDIGQAREDLDAKYEGAEMTVAFNPEYLIGGVEVCEGDEVVLETSDALKAARVHSTEASDYVYVLMPVRVT